MAKVHLVGCNSIAHNYRSIFIRLAVIASEAEPCCMIFSCLHNT